MKQETPNKQIIIAGPCALENEEHARVTVTHALELGIQTVRMNLWKPRTAPGFEGAGERGLPWLDHATDAGLTIAMEVLLPEHVDQLMNHVLLPNPHATLLVWIGSRNQNHMIQTDIGHAVAGENRIHLMIKNQPWRSKTHWMGILEHVKNGGAEDEQLSMCHRGFAPHEPGELRNIPDWTMAQEVQRETGLPMLIDPSHIGGRQDLVMEIAREATSLDFDGQVIEVHPNPRKARTDAPQQLDWDQMRQILPFITNPKRQ